MNDPKIKVGQIWREVDPRFERYIRILGVHPGRRGVCLETVGYDEKSGWSKRPRTTTTYADAQRFNGKRGGYALHEDAKP